MCSRTLLAVVAISFVLAAVANSQEQPSVQLFGPGVGVLIHRAPLYSTDDNGKTWKAVVPESLANQAVATYFLNRTQAWMLLASGDYGETQYDLASTNDSWATWSLTHIDLKLNPNEIIVLPQGHMQFSDVNHGWINLDVQSGSAFHVGYLLRTVDGGKNWTFAGGPSAGEIRFVDPRHGWLAFGGDLWVTHDAAKTWEPVSLTRPPSMQQATAANYQLPVFADEKNGALEVAFCTPPAEPTQTCYKSLFITKNDGKSWRFNQVLDRSESWGQIWAVQATDSIVINTESSDETLTLVKAALDGRTAITRSASDLGFQTNVLSASFISPEEGWVLTDASCTTTCSTCVLRPAHVERWHQHCPALLSTNDGGKTWTDITLRQTCVIDSTTWKKTCTRQ